MIMVSYSDIIEHDASRHSPAHEGMTQKYVSKGKSKFMVDKLGIEVHEQDD